VADPSQNISLGAGGTFDLTPGLNQIAFTFFA
jgi:hypothetical protein